jgi:putative transposase
LLEYLEKPLVIRCLAQQCCSGPEFISHEFVRWTTEHGIRIEYIQPGKPQQNAYIERYNRTIRYSWLSKHLFDTLDEVQDYATNSCVAVLLRHYNHKRPHQANKGKPPLVAA